MFTNEKTAPRTTPTYENSRIDTADSHNRWFVDKTQSAT